MEESRSFPFGKCPFIGYSSTASRSPFPHKGRLTRKPNSPLNPNLLFPPKSSIPTFKLLFVFLLQIPEKSLTSIPMYGTIIYYKESRKALGKEAEI